MPQLAECVGYDFWRGFARARGIFLRESLSKVTAAAAKLDTTAAMVMVHKAPLKIFARGVVSYFYFSGRRGRAENAANQQCHLKVPDGALLR